MKFSLRTVGVLAASIICATLLAGSVMAPGGCATEEDVKASRDAAAARKSSIDNTVVVNSKDLDDLKAQIAALTAKQADPSTTADQKAAAQAVIDDAKAKSEAMTASIAAMKTTSANLGTKIAKADDLLKEQPNAPNSGTTIGGVLGAFTGNPALLAAIAAAGTLFVRGLKLSSANKDLQEDNDTKTSNLNRVVGSIDALATVAPEVGLAIKKHSDLLDKVQGPDAKAAVDAAQHDNDTPAIKLAA